MGSQDSIPRDNLCFFFTFLDAAHVTLFISISRYSETFITAELSRLFTTYVILAFDAFFLSPFTCLYEQLIK